MDNSKLTQAIRMRNEAWDAYRNHNCKACEEDRHCSKMDSLADNLGKRDQAVVALGGTLLSEESN